MSVAAVEDRVESISGPVQISVVETQPMRKGIPTVVGSISVKDLVGRFAIPRRDFNRKTGYQREPSTSRINQLKGELEANRVDLPTAILANIRKFDPIRNFATVGQHHVLNLFDEELYIVDGQHRVESLVRLYEKDPVRWGAFRLAVSFMLGATELQELEAFYVVNSTAKSVRTDLALDLLKQQAEANPELLEALEERGHGWKVVGQTIAEELAKTSCWKGRIRFPGEPVTDTTINSAGIVSSLQSVLATPYFTMISTPNQVAILDAFWQGIREVLPECFHEPERYALQKSIGVQVMHQVLVSALEAARSSGSSVTDPSVYADLLRQPLAELEGDTRSGGVVRGGEFWLSGSDGAAGQFSSNAGRRVLTARVKRLLPRIEVN
jgi:DGQHR domain-containing protein